MAGPDKDLRDPRIYEVTIALLGLGGDDRTLTPEEGRAIIDAFESVRHDATKWRLMTQRAGRLLIIEPQLIGRIEAFLEQRA